VIHVCFLPLGRGSAPTNERGCKPMPAIATSAALIHHTGSVDPEIVDYVGVEGALVNDRCEVIYRVP
jgi:hypothetical protein